MDLLEFINADSFRLIVNSFFQGSIWILLLYNLFIYLQTREKSTIFYCVYLLFISLNYINYQTSFMYFLHTDGFDKIQFGRFEQTLLAACVYFCYFLFIKHYLETPKTMPKVDKVVNAMMLVSALEFVSPIALYYLKLYDAAYLVHTFFKLCNLFLGIFVYFLFYKNLNKLIAYIFVGSMFLLVGTLSYFVLRMVFPEISGTYFKAIDILTICILIEALIFSLGIGYKYRLTEEEKAEAQTQLIAELQSKEKYQMQMQEEMQKELKVQTQLIEQNQRQLLEAEFNTQFAKLETQLLRTQMNPHFLFNSLNSLKQLIINRKESDAAYYTDKFSALLRGILNQSRAEFIKLEEEINTLKRYLELENLRFNNELNIQFEVAKNIDLSFTEIPPMILQPFIENALWHGLMPKNEGEKILKISFSQQEEVLKVAIEDNGIGRSGSADFQKDIKKHKSMGSKIVADRLKMLSDKNENSFSSEIIDLFDETGKASGTRVLVKFLI